MGQFVFGSGTVLAIPAANNATPQAFGTLQDVTIDFSFSNKELYGQYQFPVAVGRGPAKVTGKAKAASFSANFFNQYFFGLTPSSGGSNVAVAESHTVATTVTVSPQGGGTYTDDGGVFYSVSGNQFVRVAATPGQGAYSVNTTTGAYTFNAADVGTLVNISYTYTSSAGFSSSVITNQLMGTAPTFKIVLNNTYLANSITLELYQVISDKLALAFKNTDWSIPEFDFTCFTNQANNLGKLTLSQF